MLDVPRELVRYLSRLLAAERRARGTRRATRALTCWYLALMVLARFRNGGDKTLPGAGFGISRATCYRCLAEGLEVLTAQAPDPHDALRRAPPKAGPTSSSTANCSPPTGSPRPPASTASSSTPDTPADTATSAPTSKRSRARTGYRSRASDVLPGHLHDLACTQRHDLDGALYQAASHLDLPTPADAGYDGAGKGTHTPVKQPSDGRRPGPDNRAYNMLPRSLRCLGERGFALLIGRWHALRHTTTSPRDVGDIVRAALVLTHFEYHYLPDPR